MQTALKKMEIMSMIGRSPGMFGECLNGQPFLTINTVGVRKTKGWLFG